ncbi:hypothetical protein ABW20_dc0101694 [Dactylellina cionopaga]|nr:hypothetical protein ABW20_dc0101694 [Dactylellina cionopaga]
MTLENLETGILEDALRITGTATVEKINALRKLLVLKQSPTPISTTATTISLADAYVKMKRYLDRAEDILNILGPEYDELVGMKVVQGLDDQNLKRIVSVTMFDMFWTMKNIKAALMASVR